MNAKFQEHLKTAEKIGFQDIKTLKRAFRNLEKNERIISKKYGLKNMISTFSAAPCDKEDSDGEFAFIIERPFFMLKGSSHQDRRNVIMNYIFAVTPTELCNIEARYCDIPVESKRTPIKMKRHRSKKWRNGKKK